MIKRPRVTVLTIDQIKKPKRNKKIHSFTINKSPNPVSPETDRANLRDLFDDMHSDRLQHERKMERSMEFAKNYICKD